MSDTVCPPFVRAGSIWQGDAVYDEILYEVDDPVATITLNRPDALNAWTATMGEEFHDAIQRAEADPAVVGIIVTGAGRAFCSGADLGVLSAVSSGDGDPLVDVTPDPEQGDFEGRFPALMGLDKPVIAAVNGACAGMAFPLALCCDLRFGTPDSLFLTAFVQRGLIAEWGLAWMLPRIVGSSTALDLLFSSRKVAGDEAKELGLLDRCVPADELLGACRDYIENLAANSSPLSMAIMKRQVYEQLHRGLGPAEAESQQLMLESFGRAEYAEGVQSFLEKRPPRFPRLGNDSGR